MNIREQIDRRNALVKQSRDIIDAAGAEGFTPEQRTQLEKIDKDLDSAQKDLDLATKAEARESALRSGRDVPKNDPAGNKAADPRKEHALKVNAEFRSFALSDTRGEFQFKGREFRAMQADSD